MSAIVDFMSGEGRDRAGRRHRDVLRLDNGELERWHDFIQWLFPLAEPSTAVPGSPVLSAAEIAAIRGSAEAQTRLSAAARRMAEFFEDQDAWLAGPDHNHLRITRVIRSLRLLVGDAAADAFKAKILARALDAPISDETRRYWRDA